MADLFDMGLEEDPASDFLARERDELAGLDDDFGGLAVESTEPAESAETVEESSAAVDSNPAPLDDNFGLGELFFQAVGIVWTTRRKKNPARLLYQLYLGFKKCKIQIM